MSAREDVAIQDVRVPADRARGLDMAWVEGLAEIIDAEGLIQPIAVRVVGDGLELVAGGHRFAACQSLGWETIPAIVYGADFTDADLIETLENLARRELNALDRAKHFSRFKAGYEAKHGPIERGGDRKSVAAKDQSLNQTLWSFHEAIAERTGLSRPTIFRHLAVWNGLASDSYERISCLPDVASNFSQLKQLSEQNHDRQDEALSLIETDPKVNSVGDALNALDGIERQSVEEKKVSVVRGAWTRLNKDQRLEFLSGCEDEVRAYAIQKGWING